MRCVLGHRAGEENGRNVVRWGEGSKEIGKVTERKTHRPKRTERSDRSDLMSGIRTVIGSFMVIREKGAGVFQQSLS